MAAGEKPDGGFFGLPSSFKGALGYLPLPIWHSLEQTPTALSGLTARSAARHIAISPLKKLKMRVLCVSDQLSRLVLTRQLVQIFRAQGGIPICKTAIPQTLLAFECSNPVFGVTTNPHSSARTPGGSSGGEAALIVLRGTPIGWGSDSELLPFSAELTHLVGGSLRIPAAYSGCCGLKPAVGRWPAGGNRATIRGFDGIKVGHNFSTFHLTFSLSLDPWH